MIEVVQGEQEKKVVKKDKIEEGWKEKGQRKKRRRAEKRERSDEAKGKS